MTLYMHRFIYPIDLKQSHNMETDLKELLTTTIYGNTYYAIKIFGTKFMLLLNDRDKKVILTISILQTHKKEMEDYVNKKYIEIIFKYFN